MCSKLVQRLRVKRECYKLMCRRRLASKRDRAPLKAGIATAHYSTSLDPPIIHNRLSLLSLRFMPGMRWRSHYKSMGPLVHMSSAVESQLLDWDGGANGRRATASAALSGTPAISGAGSYFASSFSALTRRLGWTSQNAHMVARVCCLATSHLYRASAVITTTCDNDCICPRPPNGKCLIAMAEQMEHAQLLSAALPGASACFGAGSCFGHKC